MLTKVFIGGFEYTEIRCDLCDNLCRTIDYPINEVIDSLIDSGWEVVHNYHECHRHGYAHNECRILEYVI